jgi:DNA helicase-2/ATP-dependent DNA helicase PcrA
VGDDDQSIYGWRGAEVAHILRFNKDWPDAKVVRLEVNYRSTREILEWANRLIVFNKVRHPKMLRATTRGEPPRILQLEDEETEARTVVEEIQSRIQAGKRRARDFAILFRTNEQPRAFEMELRRAKVPYVLVGGMSFYDRKEVRDILAYLKLLTHPRDEVSLLRVINAPPRGVGQATVTRLLEKAVAAGKPVWELLGESAGLSGVPPAALKGIAQLRGLIGKYQGLAHARPPAEVIRGLIDEIRYRDEITRIYPDPNEQTTRWASVEEVVNAAASYTKRASEPTLSGFLQDVVLNAFDNGDDKEKKLERDAIALMTLHAAKGLEFTEVYMVGMEEGFLPHHRSIDADGDAIDEERRLCYVGVTRAQRRLTLTLALGRQKWGKPRQTVPSRFLYEVTGKADSPNYQAAVTGRSASTFSRKKTPTPTAPPPASPRRPAPRSGNH